MIRLSSKSEAGTAARKKVGENPGRAPFGMPWDPWDTFEYRLKQGPFFDGKGTLFEALDYSLPSLRAMSL